MIDLRISNEFEDEHIAGAINLPLEDLDAAKFLTEHKQRPLFLICNTGKRAYEAAEQFYKIGFYDIYILAGGILSWRVLGFPLTGKKH